MRLWLEPLLPQQHVQHLQQQMAHSAPQQMQRAMHHTTLKAIMPPTMMATITGHLDRVSKGVTVNTGGDD
jgi:hypothetical protein